MKQKLNNSLLPHHIQWSLQSIILLRIIFLQVMIIYCGLYKSDTFTILPQLLSSCVHHSISAVPAETLDGGFITLCKAPTIQQNPSLASFSSTFTISFPWSYINSHAVQPNTMPIRRSKPPWCYAILSGNLGNTIPLCWSIQ